MLARKLQKASGPARPKHIASRCGAARGIWHASGKKRSAFTEPGPQAMKLITAVIRPHKFDDLELAVARLGAAT